MADLRKYELPPKGAASTQADLIAWIKTRPANWNAFLNAREKWAGDVTASASLGLDPCVVIKSMVAWERSLSLRWAFGNAKLAPEHIATYSLMPGPPAVGGTCPGSRLCIVLCYALSGRFPAPDKIRNTYYNTLKLKAVLAARGKAGLVELLERDVRLIFENMGWKMFRPHDSGDFFCAEYMDAWIEVARRNPGITVYFYTKSLGMLSKRRPLPKNMKAFQSVGGVEPVDRRFPFASIIAESSDSAMKKVVKKHGSKFCYMGEKGRILCTEGDAKTGTPSTGEAHITKESAHEVILPFHGARWQALWLVTLTAFLFVFVGIPLLRRQTLGEMA